MIRLIDSFIRNREFKVHTNQGGSESIVIPAGPAQETCISPILYALYVADIPKSDDTDIALYADDTALYTSAKTSNTIVKRLNSSLQTLQHYFRKWKIKINNNKTQAIIFPFDNKRHVIQQINSNAVKIPSISISQFAIWASRTTRS